MTYNKEYYEKNKYKPEQQNRKKINYEAEIKTAAKSYRASENNQNRIYYMRRADFIILEADESKRPGLEKLWEDEIKYKNQR